MPSSLSIQPDYSNYTYTVLAKGSFIRGLFWCSPLIPAKPFFLRDEPRSSRSTAELPKMCETWDKGNDLIHHHITPLSVFLHHFLRRISDEEALVDCEVQVRGLFVFDAVTITTTIV